MKLIETVTTKKHIVDVYLDSSKNELYYHVIPKTKITEYPYPVSSKIKAFSSREDAYHYIKSL